ncbi:ABC transporter permease [Paenibacillus hodogayensis]|uniref:ABC transporter permease n=1 Tax=Paenibacillus hodogayensis TaxID=279208 RepID=A0ABV5VTM3_9BACL
MTPLATFWALVRHEYRGKGSWRKQNRSPITRRWKAVYAAIMLAAGLGVTLYLAVHHTLRFEQLWYVTYGLPYMFFFFGYGSYKREWENETYGWWLTMPYPRFWLIAAKWLGALLRILTIWTIVYVLAFAYVSLITIALESYTFADVGHFMVTGFNWLVLTIGFSPFITALGLFTGNTQYTTLRPLLPVLWVLCMGGMGTLYSASFNSEIGDLFAQMNGEHPVTLLPFSWMAAAVIVASWLAAYGLIRLSAYLLDRRLLL